MPPAAPSQSRVSGCVNWSTNPNPASFSTKVAPAPPRGMLPRDEPPGGAIPALARPPSVGPWPWVNGGQEEQGEPESEPQNTGLSGYRPRAEPSLLMAWPPPGRTGMTPWLLLSGLAFFRGTWPQFGTTTSFASGIFSASLLPTSNGTISSFSPQMSRTGISMLLYRPEISSRSEGSICFAVLISA